MKKRLSWMLAAALLVTSTITGCAKTADPGSTEAASAESTEAASLSAPAEVGAATMGEAVQVPLYLGTPEEKMDISLYFRNGQTDIPYIDADTCVELEKMLYNVFFDDFDAELTVEKDGPEMLLTRENGTRALIDFQESTIGWEDYNGFISRSYQTQPMDMLMGKYTDENGEPRLFKRANSDRYRRGGGVGIELKEDFDIELVYENGVGYMPLQTFSDLFYNNLMLNLAYNGEAVFLVVSGELGEMKELYYSAAPRQRSEALTRFTYQEMCLALQFNYGMKELHGIPSFGTAFKNDGMDARLKSLDGLEADVAVHDFINLYVDDGHSKFLAASPYAGDVEVKPTIPSISRGELAAYMEKLGEVRSEAYPDGVPGYQEIGNTAYITFDSYYAASVAKVSNDAYICVRDGEIEPEDTISLIVYAHQQITREGSPIENVVLDMSMNLGGDASAAIYTICWFLGDCTLNIEDEIMKSFGTMIYQADVNLDGKFDKNDSIAHLNRYCITSPVSFSCGNFVPCALKASNQVTILGKQSAGGACAVQYMTNADGTIWRLSSRRRLSTLFNGAYYDVDQGVTPDYLISQEENFYDRQMITKLINSAL